MAPLLNAWLSSRRSLLAGFMRSAGSLFVARGLAGTHQSGSLLVGLTPGADEPRLVSVQQQAESAPIYVSVHAPGGDHYSPDATVLLRSNNGEILQIFRPAEQVLYEAQVPPGDYMLEVTAPDHGWIALSREVVIPAEGKTASAYLGEEDWPFYRLGENIVLFEPHDDLIGIVFETGTFDFDEARDFAPGLAAELSLETYTIPSKREIDPNRELPFAAASGAIWIFKSPEIEEVIQQGGVDQQVIDSMRQQIAKSLREILEQQGRPARVGLPVDLTRDQVKVLDNRFVVKFQPNVTDAAQRAESVRANILRQLVQAPNLYLLELDEGGDGQQDARGFRQHLDAIEDLFNQNSLVYGEPDLLAELIDTAFPDDPPVDYLYSDQHNLSLQKVDQAWKFIKEKLGLDLMLGSPDVYVATYDRGVQLDHPEIEDAFLTDGTKQIAEYRDFSGMQDCLADGAECLPDKSHGMGVYGIIAARTNNELSPDTPQDINIAGIAPNTHQIVIKRPEADSAVYKDVLLWIAGLHPPAEGLPLGWPAEPISHPADIINCSHEAKNLPLSGLMDDTLRFLTAAGRDNLGTIIIYSAGNDKACITGTETWAAHSSAIAISNTDEPDPASEIESRNIFSNWGPEVDLCARGEGVWSLNASGGAEQFWGTSAAAPTVAAAAALMLSVNPDLSWSQVRQILCKSAEQVDPEQADADGQWSPEPDSFSKYYGNGRLNVLEAVKGAWELRS